MLGIVRSSGCCSRLRTAGAKVTAVYGCATRHQPKEEQHQLPSLAHVPKHRRSSQAEVRRTRHTSATSQRLVYHMYIASHGATWNYRTISVHAWEESTILWINTAFWWKYLCRMHCVKSWLFADALYFYPCITYHLLAPALTRRMNTDPAGWRPLHRYCKMYCRGVVVTKSITTAPRKMALNHARSRRASERIPHRFGAFS